MVETIINIITFIQSRTVGQNEKNLLSTNQLAHRIASIFDNKHTIHLIGRKYSNSPIDSLFSLAHNSPAGKSWGSKLCRIPHKFLEKNVETPKWM
jgi:hypothetical protein